MIKEPCSTALYIDTHSRKIMVSTVAVTQTAYGLVLRYGSEVGTLESLTRSGEMKDFSLPIIVGTRGYQAMSSDGFLEVVVGHQAVQYATTQVVGVQGFPWMKGGGLSLLSEPQSIVILRPGTNLIPVSTGHETANPEGYRRHHSNPASKEAALEGLRLRAKTHPRETLVIEGQSDYCHGWRLVGYHEIYDQLWSAEWPTEHREDRFTADALVLASVRGYTGRVLRYQEQSCGATAELAYRERLARANLLSLADQAQAREMVPGLVALLGADVVGEIAKALADQLPEVVEATAPVAVAETTDIRQKGGSGIGDLFSEIVAAEDDEELVVLEEED